MNILLKIQAETVSLASTEDKLFAMGQTVTAQNRKDLIAATN